MLFVFQISQISSHSSLITTTATGGGVGGGHQSRSDTGHWACQSLAFLPRHPVVDQGYSLSSARLPQPDPALPQHSHSLARLERAVAGMWAWSLARRAGWAPEGLRERNEDRSMTACAWAGGPPHPSALPPPSLFNFIVIVCFKSSASQELGSACLFKFYGAEHRCLTGVWLK